MILIFPYDIVIGSGFKMYIFFSHFLNMEIILLITFYLFFHNNRISVEVYKFGVSGWCAAVS